MQVSATFKSRGSEARGWRCRGSQDAALITPIFQFLIILLWFSYNNIKVFNSGLTQCNNNWLSKARSLRCPQKSLQWLFFWQSRVLTFPWRMSLIKMSCLSTNKQQIKGEAIDFFGARFGATASGLESFHSCRGRRPKKPAFKTSNSGICSYTPENKTTLITFFFFFYCRCANN